TNVLNLLVDVTPPPHPTLTLTASNDFSATVSWTSYAAPPDIAAFRAYLSQNPFSSVSGQTAVLTLGSSARNMTYSGLALDRQYYGAVAAVDTAGNSTPQITTLPFILASTVPPPVAIQASAIGPASAQVTWSSYSTANLLGFAGFRLYYE